MIKRHLPKIGFGFTLFVFMISCSTEGQFRIEGRLSGFKQGKIYLQKIVNSTYVSLDSISVLGDTDLSFGGPIESPEVLWLYIQKKENSRLPLFVEPGGVLRFEGHIDSLFQLRYSGSASQDKLIEYQSIAREYNVRMAEAYTNRLDALKNGDQSAAEKYDRVYRSTLKNRYFFTVQFALNNPNSPASPYVVLNNVSNFSMRLLDSVVHSFDQEVRTSLYGKSLLDIYTTMDSTRVGKPLPSLSLPDTAGAEVSFDAIEENKLLIFWSGDEYVMNVCRSIVSEYDEWVGAGIQPLFVGIYTDKEEWVRNSDLVGIKQYNFSDLKGTSSSVVRRLTISKIPYMILVNREGKIVSRGEELGRVEDVKALLNTVIE